MKCEDRERSLLLVKIEHPEDWPWDPGQEVGSQGVLFHRKEQGLWTYRVHRKCNSAKAIVSELQRPIL